MGLYDDASRRGLVAPLPSLGVPKSQQLAASMTMGPPSTQKELGLMQQQGRAFQQAQTNERYEAAGQQMAQEARAAAATRQNRAATRPLYGADSPSATPGQQALVNYDVANPPAPSSAPATPPAPSAGPTMADELRRQQSMAEEAARVSAGPQSPPAGPGLAERAGLTPGGGPSGNVTRDGNSYSGTNISGDITVNGQAPGGTGPISAQSMAAADVLAQPRGLAERAGLTPGGGQGSGSPAVTGPTIAQALGFLPPTVRHSGNDWAARNALRSAEVSASSITNQNVGRNRTTPAQDAYRTALANDTALQQAEPAMAQATMRENAGLQREAMQQEGANGRSMVQAMQAQQRLAMDRETQGIVNRGKTIVQRMQEQIATEQDPTKRQSIAQRLRELNGQPHESPYKLHVTPTTKNVDGSTTMGSVLRINNQTGDVQDVQQPGRDGAAQQKVTTQEQFDALPKGATYTGEDGRTYRKPG